MSTIWRDTGLDVEQSVTHTFEIPVELNKLDDICSPKEEQTTALKAFVETKDVFSSLSSASPVSLL